MYSTHRYYYLVDENMRNNKLMKSLYDNILSKKVNIVYMKECVMD